jgi:hypothetical protein
MDLMRSRQPENRRKAIDVLGAVNSVYVECGRDKVIREVFDDYLDYTMANQRYGRIGKGQAFYLTGESGAGKTDAVEHLFKHHPVLQPVQTDFGFRLPYVSVTLEGPATLANLGNAILAASGYEAEKKLSESAVWPLLPGQLAMRSIFLVHIDETQHLLGNPHERGKVVKSLKGLMNRPDWPLRVVLTGMPETNDMLSGDDQAERRNFSVELEKVQMPAERILVDRIIKQLCAAAGILCDELLKTDMPARIAHAANFQYGRIAEVTIAGIHSAILEDAAELTRDDLARAYIKHSHSRGKPEMNPFLTDSWKNLTPGYFIVDRRKKKK